MALQDPPLQPRSPHPPRGGTPLCHPRVLARGPYWARLPALLANTHAASEGLSQGPFVPSTVQGPSVPPIVLPDRIGTTRVLLHDTQACIQKFSARMDVLGAHVEQALKEVQLSRAALEISGEKTVADIADVVYKCQASLVKSIEAQGSALDKASEKISQLNSTNDTLVRLYDAHHSSLNLLLQTSHTHTNAIQALQTQQCQNLAALAPLEGLVKAVPVHVDTSQSTFLAGVANALGPAMEKAVECGIERALAKKLLICVDAQPRALDKVVVESARGKKRKRVANEDLPSDTVPLPPIPRRPSVPVTHEYDTTINKPSESSSICEAIAAPNHRQLASRRTRARGSMRHPSTQLALEMGTGNPELLARVDEREIYVNAPKPPLLSRTRQVTLPISCRKPISEASRRTHSRSISHTRASNINSIRIDVDDSGLSSTISANVSSDITFMPTVYTPETTAPRHPVLSSLCHAIQENRTTIIDDAPRTESDGFGVISKVDVTDSNAGRSKGRTCKSNSAKSKGKPKSKNNTNKTRPKGPGNKKGKKASSTTLPVPCPPSGVANPDTIVLDSKGINSGCISSNDVETSGISERDKPNSLSRAFMGGSTQSAVANNVTTAVEGDGNGASPIQYVHMTSIQAISELASATAPERQTQANIQESTHIPYNVSSLSLLNMGSIFSSPPREDRVDVLADSDAGTRLAAALAHIHSDIDFTGQGAYTQSDSETRSQADIIDDAHNDENNLDDIDVFAPPQPSFVVNENTPRKNTINLNNQPNAKLKRFLLDDDFSEIDLCFGGLSD